MGAILGKLNRCVGPLALFTMPKWVAYCQECDHVSDFQKIAPSALDLAAPKAKKPVLPPDGETWHCPVCKRQTRVRECDLTYSHAL